MKKKEAKSSQPIGQPSSVAAVEPVADDASAVIACVQGNVKKKFFADSVVKVVKLEARVCDNSALVDTESPISFINASVFKKSCKLREVSLKMADKCYKSLNGHVINILGIWSTSIVFEDLPSLVVRIDLHVLKEDAISADIIVGRDFLSKYQIVSIRSNEEKSKVALFSEIAFVNADEFPDTKVFSIVQTDLDQISYEKLMSTLREVEGAVVTPPQ